MLRKQGKVCEYSAHRDVIVEHLTQAVKLDPRRLARAKVDADLDPIRDTLGWQRLLGRSPEQRPTCRSLLRHVSWFGPGVGVYGTTQGLRFHATAGACVVLAVDEDDPAPRRRPAPTRVEDAPSGGAARKGRPLRER